MESNEYDGDAIKKAARFVEHIGIKRRSGRYPWGSGGRDELARSRDFKSYYEEMRSKGVTDTQIAEYVTNFANSGSNAKHHPIKFSTTDLRAAIAISTETIHAANVSQAARLKAKGLSTTAIAERMGLGKSGESTVRGWLKGPQGIKEGSLRATANVLKETLEDKPFLDVGKGTHLYMGIAETKLRQSLAMLRDEGYSTHNVKGPQLGTGKLTNYLILTKPGVSWHEAKDALREGRLAIFPGKSDDNGLTYMKPPKGAPLSVDLKRVEVAFKEDGGAMKDGVIELRRGVDDISLGANRYAQVRVAVGAVAGKGTHYMKGMAIYADDLPPGVDMRFNSNKSKGDPKVLAEGKLGAMKPLKEDKATGKIDEAFPFGSQVRPHLYKNAKGETKTSLLNLVNEEGNWDEWSKNLSSQMLSKQSLVLAQSQLNKAAAKRGEELAKIKAMTNPVVKEKLLMEFADSADSASVHLKAAAIERQATSVILPIKSMRPTEIYAPNFKNGERVVLVRHPHGGPFEIPELTVNNRNREALRVMKGARDAVGIHHSVAEQLSGADFDGDSVLVIPNDGGRVKTRPPLAGLKGFDAKEAYTIPHGDTTTRRMTKADTQKEMGKISNLITDMSIRRASDDELARAVRHSMVVIDAEKHGLNYKLSEQDNNIKQLKEKYQDGANRGAATIISRASATAHINQRKQLSGAKGIDPKTGEKVFVDTGRKYDKPKRDKNGNLTGEFETILNQTKGTRAEFVNDARKLLSGGDERDPITPDRGQPMERIYANYSNQMKSLANQARLEQISLKMPKQSSAAKAVYAKEIASLKDKLQIAQKNAPLERRAQTIGDASYRAKVDANPGQDKDTLKKWRFQALEDARNYVGATKKKVFITDREWEAIQAGGVASTTLREILRSADMDRVRDLASPRPRTSLTSGQIALAKQLASSGYSVTDIAERLGIPRSTVVDNIKA